MIKSVGSPHWSPKLAPPRLNECPKNLLAGYPRSLKQPLSFIVKALCVRTVTLDPSLNLKRGVGEDRVGHSRDMASREEEGQTLSLECGVTGS